MASGINRLRVASAEDLLDRGAELIDETGRERLSGAHLLLAVQATRAVHIFESVIALCRCGRGVPASMLNRALLEEALEVHWVAANPNDAPPLADKHETLTRLGERALDVRHGRPAEPLTDDEQARFDDLLREFDGFNSSWTRESYNRRRALVKERWGEEAVSELDYTYEVIQKQNNVLLHASPAAYALAMSPGRRTVNRVGPDLRWRDALGHGVLGFYLISRVIAEEFSLNKEPVTDAFFQASCFKKDVSQADLSSQPDGAPCPCGSGRTVEECHAAPG